MNAEVIEVFAVGSSVLLEGSVSARVTAIFIRDSVSYEVVYWTDRDRHVENVESWEVESDGENARKTRVNPIL